MYNLNMEYPIGNYKYWTAKVFFNQEYLGRCIVSCKREDALDLTDDSLEEREELFIILAQLKKAIKKSFNNDWINYSFLGNSYRHLHCHVVPRYESSRNFGGMTFVDKRWGKNWLLDEDFKTPAEFLEAVKNKIQENL
jgi:diadenosine tetraphosphate (Ap4A) HIT family hydrolase